MDRVYIILYYICTCTFKHLSEIWREILLTRRLFTDTDRSQAEKEGILHFLLLICTKQSSLMSFSCLNFCLLILLSRFVLFCFVFFFLNRFLGIEERKEFEIPYYTFIIEQINLFTSAQIYLLAHTDRLVSVKDEKEKDDLTEQIIYRKQEAIREHTVCTYAVKFFLELSFTLLLV